VGRELDFPRSGASHIDNPLGEIRPNNWGRHLNEFPTRLEKSDRLVRRSVIPKPHTRPSAKGDFSSGVLRLGEVLAGDGENLIIVRDGNPVFPRRLREIVRARRIEPAACKSGSRSGFNCANRGVHNRPSRCRNANKDSPPAKSLRSISRRRGFGPRRRTVCPAPIRISFEFRNAESTAVLNLAIIPREETPQLPVGNQAD